MIVQISSGQGPAECEFVVTSTSERSQYLNKKNAMNKLNAILDEVLSEKYVTGKGTYLVIGTLFNILI